MVSWNKEGWVTKKNIFYSIIMNRKTKTVVYITWWYARYGTLNDADFKKMEQMIYHGAIQQAIEAFMLTKGDGRIQI